MSTLKVFRFKVYWIEGVPSKVPSKVPKGTPLKIPSSLPVLSSPTSQHNVVHTFTITNLGTSRSVPQRRLQTHSTDFTRCKSVSFRQGMSSERSLFSSGAKLASPEKFDVFLLWRKKCRCETYSISLCLLPSPSDHFATRESRVVS